jgi:Domain of unknown function (DUF4198)
MSTSVRPRLSRIAILFAVLCAAANAGAHDTWFAARPADGRGGVALSLGTGNQFPRFDTGIGYEYLVKSGCRADARSATLPLQRTAEGPSELQLRVRSESPASCWAQLAPFEVELPPEKIALYFKDIQASAAVRDAWAQMSARGVRWKERYTKHARIDLGGDAADAATPVNMAMDVLLESPQRPLASGQALQFRVLRDGQPLPDFAVELRSALSPLGVWRKTDAQGRVDFIAPLPGRWVVRGVDLRVSETDTDRWESRFVTLAFDVAAAR